MIEFEELYNESERIYKKDYSTGEYCHEQSFKWGFQEGVNFAEKKLTEWHTPDEIPTLNEFECAEHLLIQDDYGDYLIGFYNHRINGWFDSNGYEITEFMGWREIE